MQSVQIVTHGNKVGLVQNFRMVGERSLPEAGANYIKVLQGEELWKSLVESLGQWRWEAPRGLAPLQDGNETLENFILRTAKLEALQEAGFKIKNAEIVGRVNSNSTFFAHSQYVVRAEIDEIVVSQPEDFEIIGKIHFFTMEQLKGLNQTGEFDDGFTLAALALCGLSL